VSLTASVHRFNLVGQGFLGQDDPQDVRAYINTNHKIINPTLAMFAAFCVCFSVITLILNVVLCFNFDIKLRHIIHVTKNIT
jgi:hypothetical protein